MAALYYLRTTKSIIFCTCNIVSGVFVLITSLSRPGAE